MQQSNVIFGALAVAFVVFITTRGSLPTYLSVLFGTASAPGGESGSAASAAAGALGGKSETPLGADALGSMVPGFLGGLFK